MQKINAKDCTIPGFKNNTCNAGLCNDAELCTRKIAMFPDDFPLRKDIKYREDYQKCPIDKRTADQLDGNGCFYTCRVFQAKKKQRLSKEEVIRLYKEQITLTKDMIKSKPKPGTTLKRFTEQCIKCVHWDPYETTFDNDSDCLHDQDTNETTTCDLFRRRK